MFKRTVMPVSFSLLSYSGLLTILALIVCAMPIEYQVLSVRIYLIMQLITGLGNYLCFSLNHFATDKFVKQFQGIFKNSVDYLTGN